MPILNLWKLREVLAQSRDKTNKEVLWPRRSIELEQIIKEAIWKDHKASIMIDNHIWLTSRLSLKTSIQRSNNIPAHLVWTTNKFWTIRSKWWWQMEAQAHHWNASSSNKKARIRAKLTHSQTMAVRLRKTTHTFTIQEASQTRRTTICLLKPTIHLRMVLKASNQNASRCKSWTPTSLQRVPIR